MFVIDYMEIVGDYFSCFVVIVVLILLGMVGQFVFDINLGICFQLVFCLFCKSFLYDDIMLFC